MTASVTIEFFHDVICSFCFPMSYRMRHIEKEYPDVKIVHRSFALAPTAHDFTQMFGSREKAKDAILAHWDSANKNDDLHRFNIEGMRKATFLFPTSINPLLACKAAHVLEGEQGYWKLFDALQSALFVKNPNIELVDCIEASVVICGLDLDAWRIAFQHSDTLHRLQIDFDRAHQYQLNSVPALVINQNIRVNGAVSLAQIEAAIAKARTLEISTSATDGSQCRLNGGKMNCE